MIKFKSLRSRLLIAFLLLSTTICAFFIHLSVLLVEQARENTFQQMLAIQGESIKKTYEMSGMFNAALHPHLALLEDKQQVLMLLEENNYPLKNFNSALIRTGSKIIFEYPLETTKSIWLVLDTKALQDVTLVNDYMMLFLYCISAGVFILGVLSSWYLAKILSSPISKLSEDVSGSASSNTTTFYGNNRNDEIGTLSRTLSYAFEQLQEVLLREQNFTRDVSHELRTPITLIKNTLAITQDKPIDSEAVKVIEQASKELEQTVEVLLALARQENVAFEPCTILPIVEKTVLAIYTSHPGLEFNVRLNLPANLTASGNPYLISLLCQNLVNNGFYHGDGAQMEITAVDGNIVFENHISQENERPYYQGLGHGQYLVKRIANAMDWDVKVVQTNTLYKVTVFTRRCHYS